MKPAVYPPKAKAARKRPHKSDAMPNWLASELCMVASFALGAWKTFKVLKHGGTDYNLLKTWCLLGLLRVFEEYFEFLVSWVPFYWLGKCSGLALLFLPEGNVSSVVFQRVVVWGMDNAHHILNSLVVPNVIEFAVSLPWRLLLVLFPSMPPPTSKGARGSAKKGGAGKERGLASRLQHLKKPAAITTTITPGGNERRDGATAVAARKKGGTSPSPPPLPPQTPPQTPHGEKQTDVTGQTEAEHIDVVGGGGGGGGIGDLVVNSTPRASARVLRGDAKPDAVITTPAAGDRMGIGEEEEDSSPDVGGGLSRGRRSFGEIVRSALTGNSKVRLRDHLFDLSTASPTPPPLLEIPEPQPAPADATVGSKGLQERGRPKTVSGRVVLPAVSHDDATKRRAKKEGAVRTAAGVGEGNSASPSISTRPKYPTRRRPSEFSRSAVEGTGGDGGGGGDVAAGGREGGGSGTAGVRRRNGSARRSPEKKNNPFSSTSAVGSAASSAGGTTSATAVTGGDTADSRAKRLSEWRKKRADQVNAEKSRRGRAVGANGGPPSSAAGPGAHRPGGVGGGASARRFRHVERFRSEMAKVAGSPQEDADAVHGHVPVPSASNGRLR